MQKQGYFIYGLPVPFYLRLYQREKMNSPALHIVTGAYGFSGKYIAKRLLRAGYRVKTLTNSPKRPNPFAGKVEAVPYNFEHPERLAESLCGAEVLYNTYWVRFNHSSFRHEDAVRNSIVLFKAARKAGIRRLVHISITNPSADSPLEYFRGKAMLEEALKSTGLSWAILRPAVIFGDEDILLNNIAWALRKFPFFGLFGDGNFKLQPIFCDDLAKLAVETGQENENKCIDAIGPETFTYRELVELIGKAIGKKRTIIPMFSFIPYFVGWVTGKIKGDLTITRGEIAGLMSNLLCTNSPAVGLTSLSEWLTEHADTIGVRYANELQRRTNRKKAYL